MTERFYRPTSAIVLHSSPLNKRAAGKLELFTITGNKLHSPKRISDQDLRMLVDNLDEKADRPRFRGWMPPEVFYVDGATMGFYLKAGVRRTFFRGQETGKPEEVLLWLPAMVFRYEGPKHQLHAYFCKGSLQELHEDTAMLIGAFLPNISDGKVCLGSAMNTTLFDKDADEMMGKVIERFFGSTFNEWRYSGMKEVIEAFIDIAKEPDLTAEQALAVEQHFWKNMPEALRNYAATQSTWRRPSHLFR